jgi:hypothetical protein
VLELSILPLSVIFLLDFGTFPTPCYIFCFSVHSKVLLGWLNELGRWI